MALTFNTNLSSLIATENLRKAQEALGKSISRLSSGRRINSGADDPAGLAISSKLEAQIRSMGQAIRNANDGVSVLQTADGGLEAIQSVLSRMRELTVQSANSTLSDTSRGALNTEYVTLKNEIDRLANTTEFNGTKLLASVQSFAFQVGINGDAANDTITVATTDVNTSAIGADGGGANRVSGTTISTVANATTAMASIDRAITELSTARAKLGAGTNRLNTAVDFLITSRLNLTAANSRLVDADLAEETAAYTRAQILVQGGVAVLVQANILATAGLKLLGGD